MLDVSKGLSNVGNAAAKFTSGAAGADSSASGLGSLLGTMSTTVICVNLLAGLVGTAYFIYGKKNCNLKALWWGVALCVVPYFIGNTLLLIAACLAMAAAPFII